MAREKSAGASQKVAIERRDDVVRTRTGRKSPVESHMKDSSLCCAPVICTVVEVTDEIGQDLSYARFDTNLAEAATVEFAATVQRINQDADSIGFDSRIDEISGRRKGGKGHDFVSHSCQGVARNPRVRGLAVQSYSRGNQRLRIPGLQRTLQIISTRIRISPRAGALSLQPRPLTHDAAQVGEADPPHLGIYGKEQELGCKRHGGRWRLTRQIPIWLDDA